MRAAGRGPSRLRNKSSVSAQAGSKLARATPEFSQSSESMFDMPANVGLRTIDMANDAPRIDYERDASGKQPQSLLDAIGRANSASLVGKQAEGNPMLLPKRPMPGHAVVADADHTGLGSTELSVTVTKRACFDGAAEGFILRVEVENDRACFKAPRQLHQLAVLIRQREVWSDGTGRHLGSSSHA